VPVPVTDTVAVAVVVNVFGPAPVDADSVPAVVVHEYVSAPEAVKLTDPPLTTDADDGVKVTTGRALIVKLYSLEFTCTPLSVITHRYFATDWLAPMACVGL
jgi:hypothetical protein